MLHWLVTGRPLDLTQVRRYARGTRRELPERIGTFGEPLLLGNPFQIRPHEDRPWSVTWSIPLYMDAFDWDQDTPAQHARAYFERLAEIGAEGCDLDNLRSAVLLARRCGVELDDATRAQILAELEARQIPTEDGRAFTSNSPVRRSRPTRWMAPSCWLRSAA